MLFNVFIVLRKYINIKGKLLDLHTPIVMGILNITPDSFYAGSRNSTLTDAIEQAEKIISEGGTIIDVGGQSTFPTSTMLSADEELKRITPIVKEIRGKFPQAIISIDTFYSRVAQVAVEELGADLINDISGGQIDDNMFETIAKLNVPYILMHMRGTPQTMQQHTNYDNFIGDILYYFSEKVAKLNHLGINDVIIDPGFGFSKTLDQNYKLMANIKYFDIFELPLLVGISRKTMIHKLLNTTPADSLNGTSVLNMYALQSGANILRVHDVKQAVECINIFEKLNNV